MTISSEISSAAFVGDGTNATFPCPFKVFDDDHVEVYVDGTKQVLNTDYTVTGVEDASFNVVFTSAPAENAAVSVFRVVPILQQVDYLENDEFPAETHERALDLLTMMIQQVGAGRNIRYPPGDPASLTGLLPVAASRASRLLGFNSEGEAVPVVGASLGAFSTGEGHNWTAEQQMRVGPGTDGWTVRTTTGGARVKLRHSSGGHGVVEIYDADDAFARVFAGGEDPEGNRSGSPGDLFLRSGSTPGLSLYVKEEGEETDTGWRPLGPSKPTLAGASGASSKLITGIPANIRRLVIHLNNFSLSGTNQIWLRLGTSGGLVATGYSGRRIEFTDDAVVQTSGTGTTAFELLGTNAGSTVHIAKIELELRDPSSGDWSCEMVSLDSADRDRRYFGTVALSGVLDRFQVMSSAADTIDSGSVTYMWG